MAKRTTQINGTIGTQTPFDVVEMLGHPGRFEIVSTETGEIIDNANGYGYKSKPNAYKAGWYKFGGGKKKVDSAVAWWRKKEHREFLNWLNDSAFYFAKDYGEDYEKELADAAAEYAAEHHIDDYKKEYFKSWTRT
jgi:hypothetical protein